MSELTHHIADLSPERLQSLADRLLSKQRAARSVPRMGTIARPSRIPLSFSQEGIWLLEQFGFGGAAYNQSLAIHLRGDLDFAALEHSLNTTIARHESIRTRIVVSDDRPHQVIHPPSVFQLPCVDLISSPDDERAVQLEAQMRDVASRVFDWSSGEPLYRATLFRLGPQEHVLCWVIHHVVWDGWSAGIFLAEVVAFYAARVLGGPLPLSPPRSHYADHALWQRERLSSEVIQQHLAYWKERLVDAPRLLMLPSDRPRAATVSLHGSRIDFMLDASITQGLRKLCAQEGATLFMLLLTAFKMLLARWSGQHDIVVGSPTASRNNRETEGMIGFFSNILVLRTSLAGDPTCRELIQRVKSTVHGAFAHQETPFERLVSQIRPERSLAHHPIYQVEFALHNFPKVTLSAPGLSIEQHLAHVMSRCELSLQFVENAGALSGWFEYQTSLLDSTTIERWIEHLRNTLAGIVAQPDSALSSVDLLGAPERERVSRHFSGEGARGLPPGRAQAFFEEQAGLRPDQLAIAGPEGELTYAQLDRRATLVARYLRQQGVRRDRLVGVYMEHGISHCVAAFAALKAGGAVVPLDPAWPIEYLALVLEDASLEVVLAERSRLPLIEPDGARVICLEDLPLADQVEAGGFESSSEPQDLAFVVYTPDAQGLPRGVMIEHSNAAHVVAWMRSEVRLAGRRMAFVSSVELASPVLEWLGPLSGGAILSLDAIERGASDHVAVIGAAPAVLESLIERGQFPRACDLALTGSRGRSQALLADLFAKTRCERVTCVHAYPETTGPATFTHITSNSGEMHFRPVAGTHIYVLDARLRPVPIGVEGDLYVAGAGVARGYRNRSVETEARFLPNPFSAGGRLFATGDRARWHADGTLNVVRQLRNGESRVADSADVEQVEAQLIAHPAVSEAAVLRRDDPRGAAQYVAYVVPADRDLSEVEQQQREAEHVGFWRQLYEDTYQGESDAGSGFDTTGWLSSFTDLPIPADQMREWLDQTIARIRTLRPRRVLEIGSGTGLILFALTRFCERYVGTDFSSEAQRRVRTQLANVDLSCDVELIAEPDGAATALPAELFDTAVLNSVIQYFPSASYLLRVLDRVIERVVSGGSIFIGDVRNLPLLEAFYVALELSRSPDSTTVEQLRAHVRQRAAHERELVVSPALFVDLAKRHPRLAGATVLLKHGDADNELTQFRYDVILHVGPRRARASCIELDWQGGALGLTDLEQILRNADAPEILIRGVPNARLAAATGAIDFLRSNDSGTVGELRSWLQGRSMSGVNPQDVGRLAQAADRTMELDWSAARADGSFDIRLPRSEQLTNPNPDVITLPQVPPLLEEGSWRGYANNPLRSVADGHLVEQMRAHLKPMADASGVSVVIELLDAPPRTPRGELDRARLALLDPSGQSADTFEEPRGVVENLLAAVWRDALHVERIGRHDGFFDLGGDSMLAIQIAGQSSRVGLKLGARQLIENQTIAELATVVELVGTASAANSGAHDDSGEVPLLLPHRRVIALAGEAFFMRQIVVLAFDSEHRLVKEALAGAIGHLAQHHDALRMRLRRTAGGVHLWHRGAEPPLTEEFECIDMSHMEESAQDAAIDALGDRLLEPEQMDDVGLIRVVLVERGPVRTQHLIVAAHHAIWDPVTLQIFFEDMWTLYAQVAGGGEMGLPAPRISFGQWARQFALRANSVASEEEAWWRARLNADTVTLPFDGNGEENEAGELFTAYTVLTSTETRAIQAVVQRELRLSMQQIVLTAVAGALARWSRKQKIAVSLLHHGRDLLDGLDASRTVGWFSNEYPVVLNVGSAENARHLLQAVRESLLEVPGHGIGYGVLRYASDSDRLADCVHPVVSVNHLGSRGTEGPQSLKMVRVKSTLPKKARSRSAGCMVTSFVSDGVLTLEWSMNDNVLRKGTARAIAEDAAQVLREIISTC